tara:strand:- start:2848 stop:3909 length:1062 start_codon:yes stop_codon:yes gene_type:complete
MNILFTCAGRRNYLINYFKEALGGIGKTVAVDSHISAPALAEADVSIIVPSVFHPDYISILKGIIKEHEINGVISLNDLELPILSEHKKELEVLGAKIIVSDKEIIDLAFDKWMTFNFFKDLGIGTPLTYLSIEDCLEAIKLKKLEFPLILKPRWGTASIGICEAENEEELHLSYKLLKLKLAKSILRDINLLEIEKCIIIQEKIDSDEYGIDILNDFNGKYHDSFVRKKLAMRSGETDKAVSIILEEFSDIGRKIGSIMGHVGNMDCDFLVRDNKVYFLEMNPRFGGGYPFSHAAGINIPAIYIAWMRGEKDVSKFNNYLPDLAFSKYEKIMAIRDNYLVAQSSSEENSNCA